jgi:hypothetical protein
LYYQFYLGGCRPEKSIQLLSLKKDTIWYCITGKQCVQVPLVPIPHQTYDVHTSLPRLSNVWSESLLDMTLLMTLSWHDTRWDDYFSFSNLILCYVTCSWWIKTSWWNVQRLYFFFILLIFKILVVRRWTIKTCNDTDAIDV